MALLVTARTPSEASDIGFFMVISRTCARVRAPGVRKSASLSPIVARGDDRFRTDPFRQLCEHGSPVEREISALCLRLAKGLFAASRDKGYITKKRVQGGSAVR